MAKITLYKDGKRKGTSKVFSSAVPSLSAHDFNDVASSCEVEGTWILYSDKNYEGDTKILGPGKYDSSDDFGSVGNDELSSIRPLPTTGICLFRSSNYRGEMFHLTSANAQLSTINFNDSASSAIVLSGTWILCSDKNYEGDVKVLDPGRYPNSNYFGNVGNDALSSIKPLPDTGICLFQNSHFQGRMIHLTSSDPRLSLKDFNDRASSAIVLSNTWMLCSSKDYKGDTIILNKGRYPTSDSFGAVGNDELSSVLMLPSSDNQNKVVSGIALRITNKASGKVLEVGGGSMENGASVQQWGYARWLNQLWVRQDSDDGSYLINLKSDKALDLAWETRNNDGGKIQQWQELGRKNQRWKIEEVKDGWYKIINCESSKALDLHWDTRNQNGGKVQQWRFGGRDNQLWKIEAISELPVMPTMQFNSKMRRITIDKNGFPLDYHYITQPVPPFTKHRWQHLQDMLRLPDHDGKQYYMGTYSQNCSDDEGGMVFVAEISSGDSGKVIWLDELNNKHQAGGYNHPCELRRIGNMVIIAGQNWDGSFAAHFARGFTWAWPSAIDADPMNMGNGSQSVLFYDVSEPAKPKYVGQLNSCWNGGTQYFFNKQIDTVNASKIGEYYYLSFGRGQTDESGRDGVKCRSKSFIPNTRWELVEQGIDMHEADTGCTPAVFAAQDKIHIGGARMYGDTNVIYDELKFQPSTYELNAQTTSVSREDVSMTTIPQHPFGDGATFNLTTLDNGKSYIVFANVESNEKIELVEFESAD